MSNDTAKTETINIVPVQGIFNEDHSIVTLIGPAGDPFYAPQPPGSGVTSLSGGTTGLTPATATSGAVTLGGTVNVANGGTGGTATPTAGGVAYGTGSAYAFTGAGTAGYVLTSNGTSAPTWQAGGGGGTSLSITDDTTTNAVRYPLFSSVTTGTVTTEYTSSTKYTYNPLTGVLTSTGAVFGASSTLGGTTNPIVAMTGSANNYIQSYIYNSNSGTSASSDFVAYSDNGSDTHGWVDVGITSQNYADATYTVTGPNEAYLFGSNPNGGSGTGNLVYATDSTGSANAHQWYVGGFTQLKSAWKMQLTTTGLHLSNALEVASGGTNSTAAPTAGGVAYGDGSSYQFTSAGTAGYVLTSAGTGAPVWAPGGGGGGSNAQANAYAWFIS